jgi:hypothetical protein
MTEPAWVFCRNHLFHPLVEARFVSPAKPLVSLGWVADEEVDLGRSASTSISTSASMPEPCIPAAPRLADANRLLGTIRDRGHISVAALG